MVDYRASQTVERFACSGHDLVMPHSLWASDCSYRWLEIPIPLWQLRQLYLQISWGQKDTPPLWLKVREEIGK